MAGQIGNLVEPALRRCDQDDGIVAHDQNRLATWRHGDIGTDDGKVGAPIIERSRRLCNIVNRHDLQPDPLLILCEFSCRRSHDGLIVAVARNGDMQDSRPLIKIDRRRYDGDRGKTACHYEECETSHWSTRADRTWNALSLQPSGCRLPLYAGSLRPNHEFLVSPAKIKHYHFESLTIWL